MSPFDSCILSSWCCVSLKSFAYVHKVCGPFKNVSLNFWNIDCIETLISVKTTPKAFHINLRLHNIHNIKSFLISIRQNKWWKIHVNLNKSAVLSPGNMTKTEMKEHYNNNNNISNPLHAYTSTNIYTSTHSCISIFKFNAIIRTYLLFHVYLNAPLNIHIYYRILPGVVQ